MSDDIDDGQAIDALPVPQELLNKLPPDTARELTVFLSSVQRIGPAAHPLAGKIQAEHIAQIIQSSDDESKREYRDGELTRRWGFATFIVVIVFLLFLCVYLPQIDKEIFESAMKVALGFLGGVGAGAYGITKFRKKE